VVVIFGSLPEALGLADALAPRAGIVQGHGQEGA